MDGLVACRCFHIIVLCMLLLADNVGATILFALLPDNLDMSSTMTSATSVGTAASAQECVNTVYTTEPKSVAISFDEGTGDCQYSTSIYSHYLRSSGEQPKFYLRVDNLTTSAVTLESACFTSQDAEYAIMQLSFGDQECVEGTLDSASGKCLASGSGFEYGDYSAGNNQSDYLVLSKTLATESVQYACNDEEDPKVPFGGQWWCYAALVFTGETPSASLVANDYCATTYSGSNVVWVTDPMEYGYLYYWWPGKSVYLGLILDTGTSYKWVRDGTTATGLPWTSGRPVGGSNQLVKVQDDFTVIDLDASEMQLLCCKYPAPAKAYDPSVKFKS